MNSIKELKSGECQTPVLDANLRPAPGTPLWPLPGKWPRLKDRLIQPFTVLNVGNQRIGIIGIDIAGKTKNSSSPLDSTKFLDEEKTAQFYINWLRILGINKIVLLTHYQYQNDLVLASNLTGVDVIVGGDSHSLLGDAFAGFGFNTVGPYPTKVTNRHGNKVCVVQAWQYADLVGELNIKFDRPGNVLSCSGTPHLIIADIDVDSATAAGLTKQDIIDFIEANPELSMVDD